MSKYLKPSYALNPINVLDPGGLARKTNQKLGLTGGDETIEQTANSTPIAMPTADSAAIATAKRRSISAQIARRGRASTILTGDQGGTEKLGG